MKLGSLFDGVSGFPLSASRHGITPVWASEIEKEPIGISRRHFPKMKHLGDITKINGAEIEPVDIITFGSPCQDLSIAGKRAGLAGGRSGLFGEAIRIIEEMRGAADGLYPRWVVWENVTGALSSNNGMDFRAVLQSFADAEIPMPDSGKWATAGMVRGGRCDIAWRVLDAQYWGVPQRRRRIFLVADFAGERAAEVLFKRESMLRDTAQGVEPGEESAGDVGKGAETADGGVMFVDAYHQTVSDVAQTLLAGRTDVQHLGAVAVFENHRQDARYTGPLKVSPTLAAKWGTGGNNTPLVLNDQGGGIMDVSYGIVGTLRSETHGNVPCVVAGQAVLCVGDAQSNAAIDVNLSPTLNASHEQPYIAYSSIVRRLTPVECERLQGFPDGWTAYGHGGKAISDSARYRALGNSVAIPCVEYIMSGISEVGKC